MRAVFATRPEPYVVLKDLMEDRRRDIQEGLRSLRETLPAEIVDVKDAEEQSLDDLMRELNFALMEMKSDALRQIDEAIRRLTSSRVRIRDETEPHGGCESDSNCRGQHVPGRHTMIGLLVAGLFLMGLLVVPVLFAVLLFQAAVVDATPETSPTGQPGRLPVPGAVAGEGDALARGLPPGAEDLLAGTLPARRTTQR